MTFPSTQRLVLGTAQLGMSYGIANQSGMPNIDAAQEIIAAAWRGGVREFDTAQGYGKSEENLGRVLSILGFTSSARIISKISPEVDYRSYRAIRDSVVDSIHKLGVGKLHGLMLHREHLLDLWDDSLHGFLGTLRAEGMMDHIGVSVVSPEGALRALNAQGVSMIQLPSNVLDRRFERQEIFERASGKGIQLYVRSAFLQGLLLMTARQVPDAMSPAAKLIEELDHLAEAFGCTRLELLLGYARMAYPQAMILFGAENKDQVTENLIAWNNASLLPQTVIPAVRDHFTDIAETLLDPSLWPPIAR